MAISKFLRHVIVFAAFSIAAMVLAAMPSAFAQGGPPPGKGPGGGETTLGNNLSVPAVFAEGIGMTGLVINGDPVNTGLRPTATETCPTPPCLTEPYVVDSVNYYLQGTVNTWRATYLDAIGQSLGAQNVIVNWSDNLTSQYWTPRSKIRVETVLYESPAVDCTTNPTSSDCLTAYNMFSLSGTKRTEAFGTDGTTYLTPYRTVFSPLAHLTIQKITGQDGTPVGTPCVDETVYGSFGAEGGGGYTAEVNASGNLIYGYNWDIASCSSNQADLLGWWRLTFKIDPSATIDSQTVNSNTKLVAIDSSDQTSTTKFIPKLVDDTTTTLDIEIRENRRGGGKKGGGENQ